MTKATIILVDPRAGIDPDDLVNSQNGDIVLGNPSGVGALTFDTEVNDFYHAVVVKNLTTEQYQQIVTEATEHELRRIQEVNKHDGQ